MPLNSRLLYAAQGACISLFFSLPFPTAPQFQKMSFGGFQKISPGRAAGDCLGCSWCVLSVLAGRQEPGQAQELVPFWRPKWGWARQPGAGLALVEDAVFLSSDLDVSFIVKVKCE